MFAPISFDFVGLHIIFNMDTTNMLSLNLFLHVNSLHIITEIENKFLFTRMRIITLKLLSIKRD